MKIAAAKDLDPRHLGIIVGCASIVRFDAGAYIFHEAQEANQFSIIRQGKVVSELFPPSAGCRLFKPWERVTSSGGRGFFRRTVSVLMPML